MSTKIKLNTLNSGCDCRTYTTPKGNTYSFYKGIYTDIKDSEDAIHFLSAGNGTLFEAKGGPVKKVIESLKKLVKEKVVDEEKAPEESGILNVDPDAPIDAIEEPEEKAEEEIEEKEGEEKAPEESENEVVETEQFTAQGLKDLNSKQQTFLIKEVQGEEANIPRYEKDKIILLLKLQEEGANLVEILKNYRA